MNMDNLVKAWQKLLAEHDALHARVDVMTIVVANALPAAAADIATVARIQAALEVAGESFATKRAAYGEPAAEEIRRYLAALQAGISRRPPFG